MSRATAEPTPSLHRPAPPASECTLTARRSEWHASATFDAVALGHQVPAAAILWRLSTAAQFRCLPRAILTRPLAPHPRQAHVNAALRREALRRDALAGAAAPTGEARRNARRDERRRSEKPRGCWRRRADGTLALYPEGVAIADWGKPRSPATSPCEAASESMPLPRLRLSVQQRRRRLMAACGCAPLRAGAVG